MHKKFWKFYIGQCNKELQSTNDPETEVILSLISTVSPIIAVIYRLDVLIHVLFPATGRSWVVIKKLSHKQPLTSSPREHNIGQVVKNANFIYFTTCKLPEERSELINFLNIQPLIIHTNRTEKSHREVKMNNQKNFYKAL